MKLVLHDILIFQLKNSLINNNIVPFRVPISSQINKLFTRLVQDN